MGLQAQVWGLIWERLSHTYLKEKTRLPLLLRSRQDMRTGGVTALHANISTKINVPHMVYKVKEFTKKEEERK
jgi:hypothetical protein